MSNEQFLLQTLGRGPGGRDIVSRVCGSDPIVATYYILHAGFLTCVFLLPTIDYSHLHQHRN